MYIPGFTAAAASTDPITSSAAYTISIRRCGRCCANCTANTVPAAYAAFARPELKLIICKLIPSCLAMIGVNGASAADNARYGINANITITATAAYRPARGP